MSYIDNFKQIHLIGNEIRNYGNSIKERDELAYKIAKNILKKNDENPIMMIQARAVVTLYEEKYGKEKNKSIDKKIDNIKREEENGR